MQILEVQVVDSFKQLFRAFALFWQLVDSAGSAIGVHAFRPFPGSRPAGISHRVIGVTALLVCFRTAVNQPAGNHSELCFDPGEIHAVLIQVFANTVEPGDIHITEKVPVSFGAIRKNQAAVNVLTDGVDGGAGELCRYAQGVQWLIIW